MQPHNETYHNCKIEMSEAGQLTIDNKVIEYEFNSTDQNWSSRYLPYSQYDSLLNLARAIVENSAEFGDNEE